MSDIRNRHFVSYPHRGDEVKYGRRYMEIAEAGPPLSTYGRGWSELHALSNRSRKRARLRRKVAKHFSFSRIDTAAETVKMADLILNEPCKTCQHPLSEHCQAGCVFDSCECSGFVEKNYTTRIEHL